MTSPDNLNQSTFPQFLPKTKFAAGKKSWWGQLYGCSLPFVLSELVQQKDNFIVLVTSDIPSAQSLQRELEFFLKHVDISIFQFPDWETLAYDHFSPHQDIISERLSTLYHMPNQSTGILIIPVFSLMHRLPPVDFIQHNTLLIEQGDLIDIEEFRLNLVTKGYLHVNTVYEHGEFSVRGSIIDLFPMGSPHPFRLDLFDDELESIKTFDVDTQRSLVEVKTINMIPAREFPIDDVGREQFRENYREVIGGDLTSSNIYMDIKNGLIPTGIEYYMPLFFKETATLFDFLPANTIICHLNELSTKVNHFNSDVAIRYEQYRHDIQRPILEPKQLFLNESELFAQLKRFPVIVNQAFEFPIKSGVTNFNTQKPDSLQASITQEDGYIQLKKKLEQFDGRILFVAESAGRQQNLLDIFKQHKIKPKQFESFNDFVTKAKSNTVGICIGYLDSGLAIESQKLLIIPESQLFGNQIMQRRRRKKARKQLDEDSIINSLAELKPGTPIVHENNGVGRYLGLETIIIDEQETEFFLLEYYGGDKLYVPVSALHLISRYTGANPDTAPLHRLGSGQWEKAKRKAKEKIRDVAAELLEIYAKREAQQGEVYNIDEKEYQQFAQAFPFEETPDQQQAIEKVLSDMAGPKPMDRLVCGDVGFGKTEVAIRAAYVAVQNNKQVAILVPTTLLSQQHAENLQDRFSDLPFKIRGLSRFQTAKQQKEILSEVTDGKIDIIIGTHKLLQKDIRFKRLGLLIIDEEHRFGVRQKEKFKQLKSKVDVLTMTATPIPRTLNMSLSGIRDFSIIATPPARRLAIKTFVTQWDDATIKEACQRELMRGGQIFVLHNKVDSIESRARDLEELIPEAKIEVAHGQMKENQLESVMADFYHQRFNILVCTTIIETGIDIPTANTIIIERADRFGLAQLYQLRGRVGRSHHKAYAYLTIPPKKLMTADATKRLEAIESIEELGTGFTLATHDLEIRGAGELLGEGQSGQMQEIGFTLYTDLLDRAVKSLKAGKEIDLDKSDEVQAIDIDLSLAALIPDDYLPDVHNRLIMYKRIASATTDDDLDDIQIEMIDRFGLLPPQLKNLFDISSLKLLVKSFGMIEIALSEHGGQIIFEETPPIDPMKIIKLIQTKPSEFRLEGNNKLKLLIMIEEGNKRIEYLKHLCLKQFQ